MLRKFMFSTAYTSIYVYAFVVGISGKGRREIKGSLMNDHNVQIETGR